MYSNKCYRSQTYTTQGYLGFWGGWGGAITELWSVFVHAFILIFMRPAASQHDLQCEGEVNSLISGWKSQPVVTTRCLPAPNKLLPEPTRVYLRQC